MFLLLTLSTFHTFSSVRLVDMEQVSSWEVFKKYQPSIVIYNPGKHVSNRNFGKGFLKRFSNLNLIIVANLL